jgi:hypothetical protein
MDFREKLNLPSSTRVTGYSERKFEFRSSGWGLPGFDTEKASRFGCREGWSWDFLYFHTSAGISVFCLVSGAGALASLVRRLQEPWLTNFELETSDLDEDGSERFLVIMLKAFLLDSSGDFTTLAAKTARQIDTFYQGEYICSDPSMRFLLVNLNQDSVQHLRTSSLTTILLLSKKNW